MKVVKYALIGALVMPAFGALAQDVDVPQMQASLSMLQLNVDKALKSHSIDADASALSLGQLAEIIGVLNDPQMSSGGETARRTIETIVRKN